MSKSVNRKSRIPSLPRILYVPQAIRESNSYGPLSQKYDEYIEMFDSSSDDSDVSFTRKKAHSQVNIANRQYELETIHELKTPSKPIIHCYNASRDNVGNPATAKKSAPVKKISFVLPGLPQHQPGAHRGMSPNKFQASPLPDSPPPASPSLVLTPSASLPSISPRPVSPPPASPPLVSKLSVSPPLISPPLVLTHRASLTPVSPPPASPPPASPRTCSPSNASPPPTPPLPTSPEVARALCIGTASLSTTPSISAEAQPEVMEEQDLVEDTLQLYGDAPETETPTGLFVHKTIAIRWQYILAKGLAKETKEKLLKSYFIPKNCDLLLAPALNPEIKAVLPDSLVKRDSFLMYKQNKLGIALSALASVADMIISNVTTKQKLLKPISDACRILCDNHFWETKTRRDIIVSSMNTNLKDALLETKRDKFLFGENVSDKVKAVKTKELKEAISALEKMQTKLRLNRLNKCRASP